MGMNSRDDGGINGGKVIRKPTMIANVYSNTFYNNILR